MYRLFLKGIDNLMIDSESLEPLLLALEIDKDGPEPVYLQIAAAIKEMLRSGKLPTDRPLPPERLLAEHFGVSRMTMRQANDLLEREGLIDRQRGRGTFATPNKLLKQEHETRSFSEEIRSRGRVPSSRVISFRTVEASSATAKHFGVDAGEPLYEIERVRLADGVPIALESLQIMSRMCPRLERFNLADYSLYQILEENYGIHLARSEEEISAIQPSRTHRKMLQIPRNTAVLLVKRKTFTSDNRPLELAVTAYRGDLYTAIVHSSRPRKPSAIVH
jgi:GntR family transcriptional regulator